MLRGKGESLADRISLRLECQHNIVGKLCRMVDYSVLSDSGQATWGKETALELVFCLGF